MNQREPGRDHGAGRGSWRAARTSSGPKTSLGGQAAIVPILQMRKTRLRQVQRSQAGIQSQERLAAIPSDKDSQEYGDTAAGG